MNLGVFQVDLGLMMEFFNQDFFEILKDLMVIFGWVALEFAFLYMGVTFYRKYRKSKYTADWRWVLLAIDIPSLNVQTPMAVEQMFAHLAGAFEQPDIAATFRRGFDQRSFSFEIIGIEGYIQFLVKTEETFRDLVEAAIYAQYPEAEITEVEEYTDNFPDKFPDEEYDIWATDFGLIEDSAYPIRTYRDFEHSISKDTVLKDPMGAFLESFSRIGPGEHMWFQIIIEPISNDWKEDAIKKIKDIIGETKKTSGKKTISDYIGNAPVKILEGVGDQVFGREASPAAIESNGREEEQVSYSRTNESSGGNGRKDC